MDIPDDMMQLAELSSRRGKALALRMMDQIGENDNDAGTIIHACAFMVAGLISASDGTLSVHEKMGLGLIGDEERLTLFCDEVRTLAAQMRERKAPETRARVN